MSLADLEFLNELVAAHGGDRAYLLETLREVQKRLGHIPDAAIERLAELFRLARVQVDDTASFYSFLQRGPRVEWPIRIVKTPISFIAGAQDVMRAFEESLGIRNGEISADGRFSLSWASDIGLADQEPSLLVREIPLARVTPESVEPIVAELRRETPDLLNIPEATIANSLVQRGPVLFRDEEFDAGLKRALAMYPERVIAEIAGAKLRGRGGAGYPTAMKWKSCRQTAGPVRYIICNADEGEPGTFKDRVLLTEAADLVFSGMTIAAYAVGATEGIVYLRAEYAYLWDHLQKVLARRRDEKLLGKAILGHESFSFDIRIVMGAGAYVCGEESALIESLEGKRAAPTDRPPFPTERGYLGRPTTVNNVETYSCVARVLDMGAEQFVMYGTRESTGTKLLSVSGDCERPGVYEVPFGISLNDFLDLVGGGDAEAVQVGGPSGHCVNARDFGRLICFEDLPSGGSMMVFGPQRDMLPVAKMFIDFFTHESCGWCVPCRVGTTVLGTMLQKVLDGNGTEHDVAEIERLSRTVARTSRCGLGQMAPNPILDLLRSFPQVWESRLRHIGFVPAFDLEKSVRDRHSRAESGLGAKS